jgi:hypothetical protein
MDQVICLNILEKVERNRISLVYFPKECLTAEICLAAVNNNGWELKFVPEELKTPELCSVATGKDFWSIEHIPEEFRGPYRILTEEELLKKYTTEELLTSRNAYLRKLGAFNV